VLRSLCNARCYFFLDVFILLLQRIFCLPLYIVQDLMTMIIMLTYVSRSWKSTVEHSDETAVGGRSVAELKIALLLTSDDSSPAADQNGGAENGGAERERSEDDDDDDSSLRPEPTSLCRGPDVPVASECDENAIDERNWNGTAERASSAITDVAVDCSPVLSSGEVDGEERQNDVDVDVTDSTAGDDGGYFSLPVRRSDRHRHHHHHQRTAERSRSWQNIANTDESFERPLTYSSDPAAGSLSPAAAGLGTDVDRCRQPDDVTPSFVVSEDELRQQRRVNVSSHVCSNVAVPDSHPAEGTASQPGNCKISR